MRIFTLSLIYLSAWLAAFGCGHLRTNGPPKATAKEAPADSQQVRPLELRLPPSKGALWEVVNLDRLALQLRNVDEGTALTVNLQRGLSTTPMPPGHWELTGFEDNGISYLSMNVSKKFVFTMESKKNVYAGSIVVRCPKLDPSDLKLLKEMKFFNRYPFSSAQGLCELVVGNNFARVRSTLKKSFKNKRLNLTLGF